MKGDYSSLALACVSNAKTETSAVPAVHPAVALVPPTLFWGTQSPRGRRQPRF